MTKVFIRTLGCEKNTVDSEYAAALLVKEGCSLVDDPLSADVMMVNTCGFIEDAKKESINAILELAALKDGHRKLIISGCLAQRYADDLKKEIPEADAVIGVNDYKLLPSIVHGSEAPAACSAYPKAFEEFIGRTALGARYTACIKIAEGCNNVCSYCAIPAIRGRYRSRQPEDILAEARALADQGTKELVIIAQDVTAYGCDLKKKDMLPQLLHDICDIDGLQWVRLMYCYEDEITQALIQTINEEPKICKYIDIPIQHCNDRILQSMNRKSTKTSIISTINNLRKQIPQIVIRTTLITGYPGETKAEFEELLQFVRDMRFDRLGVFAYSKEEGTAAAKMPCQVRRDVKERRLGRIMEAQRVISQQNNERFIGKSLDVMIDECCDDGTFLGRTAMDAPEIDNGVIFSIPSRVPRDHLAPGSIVRVRILDAFDYDLCGVLDVNG